MRRDLPIQDPETGEPEPYAAYCSVKRQWNKNSNPAVSTTEVATELSDRYEVEVDVEQAYELLTDGSISLNHKEIGSDPGPDHHIWW